MIFADSPVLSLDVGQIGILVLLSCDLELDLKQVVLLLSHLLVDLHIIMMDQNLILD